MIEKLQHRLSGIGGGWVLVLMLVLSMLSIAAIAERTFWFQTRRANIDELTERLLAALRKGDRRSADRLLAESNSVEARVLRNVLPWMDGGPEAVSEALEAELAKARRDLDRGMTFLGTIGNNAPFIGLLGTVLGIIQAFKGLGEAGGNTSKMGSVMNEIAEALIATGLGLFVALPAVIGFNVFSKKGADVEANVQIAVKQILAFMKSEHHTALQLHLLERLDSDEREREAAE